MSESKQGLLVTLFIILAAVNIIGFIAVGGGDKVDEQGLADKVTAQVVGQIVIPEPVQPQVIDTSAIAADVASQISIPEYKEPAFDSRFNDIWEKEYADEIEELEDAAYDVALEELERKDYKDLTNWFEDSMEGIDEVESVSVKDYDINVVELGLEDDEDKVVTVEFELKVRYTLLEGVDDDFKKTVMATATVTFDEGDFDDEDVEFVFA